MCATWHLVPCSHLARGGPLPTCLGATSLVTRAMPSLLVTRGRYASIRTEMAARPADYKVLAFMPTARQVQFSTAVLIEMGLDVLEIHS